VRLKLTLEYDGLQFNGWQAQPQGTTVQQTLEAGLLTYLNSEQKKQGLELSSLIRVIVSGRTDSGVSAREQICHFDMPEGLGVEENSFRTSLNGIFDNILKVGLKVKSLKQVSKDFHSRFSPHSKAYSYKLSLTDFQRASEPSLSLNIGKDIDLSRMIEAARLIEGTHDFQSFRASDCCAKSTERTILLSEFSREDEFLIYRVQGTGFLKQMVRIIVGTLVDIGKGKITSIEEVISGRDRNLAGDTAPAGPLCLERVIYSDDHYFD